MPVGRHSTGSRTSPAVIALVVGVLVVVAAVAYVLLKGGGTGTTAGENRANGISRETPDFSFEVRKVIVVPTVPGDKTAKTDSDAIAQAVSENLASFYKTAYLDPNNWSTGKYDASWAFFDKTAVPDAKASADSLTLGDGSAYETVMPKPSTTTIKILMGAEGKPDTAAAQVTFGVLATDKSGAQTTVASMGQYFLRPDGKDWTIYAFRIEKSSEAGDQVVGSPSPAPKKPKPSPESSPS